MVNYSITLQAVECKGVKNSIRGHVHGKVREEIELCKA